MSESANEYLFISFGVHRLRTLHGLVHPRERLHALLHDVHVVVVVLILFLVLVAEYNVLITLVDVGLENLVRAVRQLAPFVGWILEVMVANVRISVGYANIEPFVFEYPRYFVQHFP